MKIYIKSSLSDQLSYAREYLIEDLYDHYKNKSDMSLLEIRDELAKKYNSQVVDNVCWMLDVYDGRK